MKTEKIELSEKLKKRARAEGISYADLRMMIAYEKMDEKLEKECVEDMDETEFDAYMGN